MTDDTLEDYHHGDKLHGVFNLGQRVAEPRKSRRITTAKLGRPPKADNAKPKAPPQCRGCNRTLPHGNARWCSEACRAAVIARRDLLALERTLPKTGVRDNCGCCGAEYIKKRESHLYCSDACRVHMIHAKQQQRNPPKRPRKVYLCDMAGQKADMRRLLLQSHAERMQAKALKKKPAN